MANSAKRKGDRAELEVQGLLCDLLDVPARRALGAGRKDDVGDITGVPSTVIQVADWKDALRAVREKPLECEEQRRSQMTSASVSNAPGWKNEQTLCCTWGCGRRAEFSDWLDLGPRPCVIVYYCAIHAPSGSRRWRTLV